MKPKENLFPLKMLVFSMGAMLLGGSVLLGVGVYQKAKGVGAPQCPGGDTDLLIYGKVVGMTGNQAGIHFLMRNKEGKSRLVTVDSCTGKITGVIGLQEEEPEAGAENP